jgi:hypothetical protein
LPVDRYFSPPAAAAAGVAAADDPAAVEKGVVNVPNALLAAAVVGLAGNIDIREAMCWVAAGASCGAAAA